MLKKSTTNPQPPLQQDAMPRGKSVKIAPGINEGTAGQPDGAKRVINGEAKPSKTSSTFTAPRKEGIGSATDAGYTRIDMSAGAKGNGKGNGNR